MPRCSRHPWSFEVHAAKLLNFNVQYVERENSSVEPILSFSGVVQVYYVLPELEEEDKGREEVQEIERESQVEENAQITMHMWMR